MKYTLYRERQNQANVDIRCSLLLSFSDRKGRWSTDRKLESCPGYCSTAAFLISSLFFASFFFRKKKEAYRIREIGSGTLWFGNTPYVENRQSSYGKSMLKVIPYQ